MKMQEKDYVVYAEVGCEMLLQWAQDHSKKGNRQGIPGRRKEIAQVAETWNAIKAIILRLAIQHHIRPYLLGFKDYDGSKGSVGAEQSSDQIAESNYALFIQDLIQEMKLEARKAWSHLKSVGRNQDFDGHSWVWMHALDSLKHLSVDLELSVELDDIEPEEEYIDALGSSVNRS